MKTTFVLLTAIFLSGCCGVNETITSITTPRDTTIQSPPIADSVFIQDPAFMEWYYQEIAQLRRENDELRGLPPDTVRVTKYLQSKSVVGEWQAYKVTQSKDSVWVTFRYDNGKGKFTFKVIPPKLTITVNDTQTINTLEYKEAWYAKLWRGFRDIILISLIFILAAGLLWQRFR